MHNKNGVPHGTWDRAQSIGLDESFCHSQLRVSLDKFSLNSPFGFSNPIPATEVKKK